MTARNSAGRRPSGDRRVATRTPRQPAVAKVKARAKLDTGGAQALTGLLASLPIFKGVPRRSLSYIITAMRQRHVPAGSTLFRQGEPAQEFLIIVSGRLEVTLEGADAETPPVATIDAPGWAGELALMLEEPRAVTLRAAADSELWVLPGDAFDRFVSRHRVVARNLLAALTRRILEKDRDFLGQSSLAIERARLVNELRERNAELAALAEVTRTVSASLDLDEALQIISTHAAKVTGSESATIFLYDERRDVFEVRASCDTPEGYLLAPEERRLLSAGLGDRGSPSSRSLIARAVLERKPVQIPDVDAATGLSNRRLLLRWGYRAVLAAPLLHGTRVIGAMSVRRKSAGAFSEREVELVTTFARQSAVAIDNARLFREVQDKARQLDAASRHKSAFLANMSHELRTPMNAIIGFSEVLLDPTLAVSEAEHTQFLTDILTSGKHLLSLINEVLDLSKIEAGRMELHLAPASLEELFEVVQSTTHPLAAKKSIDIRMACMEALDPFPMDAPRVKQVLLNLVGNAIKFTPVGGAVIVTARKVFRQIDPEGVPVAAGASAVARPVDAASPYVEVAVADTGPGIPKEDHERIFQEFQQAGTPMGGAKPEGTGLGLTLARKFVEMHGGRIWVTSEPGQGAAFTFTLPMDSEGRRASESAEPLSKG